MQHKIQTTQYPCIWPSNHYLAHSTPQGPSKIMSALHGWQPFNANLLHCTSNYDPGPTHISSNANLSSNCTNRPYKPPPVYCIWHSSETLSTPEDEGTMSILVSRHTTNPATQHHSQQDLNPQNHNICTPCESTNMQFLTLTVLHAKYIYTYSFQTEYNQEMLLLPSAKWFVE